jgi:3-oxoacyl-[acyl-carrier protein] reductase
MPGKVIVTGGSRGLGLGIVRRLLCDGYDAIAIARQMNDQLASTFAEAERTRRGSLRFVPFDLGEVSEIPALVKCLRREAGPIHGLVNNAAIGTAAVARADAHRGDRAGGGLNTLSPIVLTKHVVRYMMADGGGRVVSVASIAGFTGYSGCRSTARRRRR